jgi:hypothetical protein
MLSAKPLQIEWSGAPRERKRERNSTVPSSAGHLLLRSGSEELVELIAVALELARQRVGVAAQGDRSGARSALGIPACRAPRRD